MKRDEVKAHIEGITDEQLDWLMAVNGEDITSARTKEQEKARAKIDILEDEKKKLSQDYAVEKKNRDDKWQADMDALKATFQATIDDKDKSIKKYEKELKRFDGVDLEALVNERDASKTRISELEKQLTDQTAEYKFDTALNGAIRDRNGRSVTAIRSLIDVQALKESNDLTADIAKALDDCKANNPWAFAETENKSSVDLGSEHGESAGKQYEEWESRFMQLNPDIKL